MYRSKLLGLFLIGLLTACGQAMGDSPRYDPYEPGDFFRDGQSARPLLPGTIARGQLHDDRLLYTGKIAAPTGQPGTGQPGTTPVATVTGSSPITATIPGSSSAGADADAFPFPVTREVLIRGQERYTIYCSPCHGQLGDGNGLVVQRGYSPPPSFHIDRLRDAPVGHFFDVITNGWGAMPAYNEQVLIRDRWAIIAYIRALQLSQHATLDDVPPEERARLESEPTATPAGGQAP